MSTIVLLSGITFMQKPELFSLNKPAAIVADANVPKYYAYVQPAEDAQPLVAGASTNQGPSIINEDGSVSPVDMGQVLGASTKDVSLPLSDIKVNSVPNSPDAFQKYLAESKAATVGPIDNSEFEAALSSGSQSLINTQADKLILIRNKLQKLLVPVGLAKYHQLTIAQYNAAIGVLQNFTQADSDPQLVGQYLNQFLKSQQDLDAETSAVAQKYNIDPSALGSVASEATPINNAQ
jgi:hypothetical protein